MIVDMFDRIFQACFGAIKGVFTVWLIWMGYMIFKEIRKAWKMEHKHDRKKNRKGELMDDQ